MTQLDKIINKNLGPGEYTTLKKDLNKWFNLEEYNKKEKVNALLERINNTFKVDCTKRCREHPFIAARYCFFNCMKKLYPTMPIKELISYVNLKQHGSFLNYEKQQKHFFMYYSHFKAPYNKVARTYKIETL